MVKRCWHVNWIIWTKRKVCFTKTKPWLVIRSSGAYFGSHLVLLNKVIIFYLSKFFTYKRAATVCRTLYPNIERMKTFQNKTKVINHGLYPATNTFRASAWLFTIRLKRIGSVRFVNNARCRRKTCANNFK